MLASLRNVSFKTVSCISFLSWLAACGSNNATSLKFGEEDALEGDVSQDDFAEESSQDYAAQEAFGDEVANEIDVVLGRIAPYANNVLSLTGEEIFGAEEGDSSEYSQLTSIRGEVRSIDSEVSSVIGGTSGFELTVTSVSPEKKRVLSDKKSRLMNLKSRVQSVNASVKAKRARQPSSSTVAPQGRTKGQSTNGQGKGQASGSRPQVSTKVQPTAPATDAPTAWNDSSYRDIDGRMNSGF